MSTVITGKKQLVSPYLFVGGISFLVVSGITIHAAISAFAPTIVFPYIESIIQTIFIFIGIASILALMIAVGSLYEKRMNDVIIASVFLSLFLGFNIFITVYPNFALLGGLWGNLGILIAYGVLRGVAFHLTNKILDLPLPSYGGAVFKIYAWSFLIITIITMIVTAIGGATLSPGLIIFALVLLVIQFFIDALCILTIGISFFSKAITNPRVTGRTSVFVTSAAPTSIPTVASTPMTTTFDEEPLKKSDTPIATESQEKHLYCVFCGAVMKPDMKVCEACGKERV